MIVRTLAFVSMLAMASESAAQVTVSGAWVRAAPRGAPTAAAYLTLRNQGAKPDRLLGGETPVAASLGVHSMSMAGGVMRMRKLEGGLALPPGTVVTLRPGGDHLMLTGLRAPLTAGGKATMVLRFERAGRMRLTLPVLASAPGG